MRKKEGKFLRMKTCSSPLDPRRGICYVEKNDTEPRGVGHASAKVSLPAVSSKTSVRKTAVFRSLTRANPSTPKLALCCPT